MSDDTASISPYLYYEDVDAALAFLTEAFGFVETMRMNGPDGRTGHAEMALGGGVVMMGHPGPDYQNPKHTGHATACVHIYVEDVDAHFERAKGAGATIVDEPRDQAYGDRRYAAEDPEGHHWFFAMKLETAQ